MFYFVSVCPTCSDVDVSPDYEQELTESVQVESNCTQCAFNNSDDAVYANLLIMHGDHCAHVEDYLGQDIPF